MNGSNSYRISYSIDNCPTDSHRGGITCICVSDSKLWTGGKDGLVLEWTINRLKYQSGDGMGEDDKLFSLHRSWNVNKTRKREMMSLAHEQSTRVHSDWINDMILIQSNSIASASSDRCIYITNSEGPSKLGHHSDYVKCLCHNSSSQKLMSGGLDKRLLIWDLETKKCTDAIKTNFSIYTSAFANHSLAMGGTQKMISIYDDRNPQKLTMSLSGHVDHVRSLLLSADGRNLLSGSSDKTVKEWDLAMPHIPVLNYAQYTDSICSLYASENLTTFWTGTRQGYLWKTVRTRSGEGGDSILLGKENGPILKMVAKEGESLWNSCGSSSLHRWQDIPVSCIYNSKQNLTPMDSYIIPAAAHYSYPDSENALQEESEFTTQEEDINELVTIWKEPVYRVSGYPALVRSELLNNKRHVLVENDEGVLTLFDILHCSVLGEYRGESFSDVLEKVNTKESIPQWCTVDIRMSTLTIHLYENTTFDAEVYLDELQVEQDSLQSCPNEDQRVNLGHWILHGLFANYIPHIQSRPLSAQGQESPLQETILPSPPPLALVSKVSVLIEAMESEDAAAYMCIFKSSVSDLGSESVIEQLDEIIPVWLFHALQGKLPEPQNVQKISFQLDPFPNSGLSVLPGGNRLTAQRMLRISKIQKYISMKLNLQDKNIDIYCGNQLLRPNLTLGTVKTHYTKSIPIIFYFHFKQ